MPARPNKLSDTMPKLPYNRIISLVPSLTELLIDLKLEDQLIGRTRFCIHPKESVKHIEIVGGTKNPNIEKIIGLEPDLIIANKEENRKQDIAALKKNATILLTEINTIEDALLEINRIGRKTGTATKAAELVSKINQILQQKPVTSPLQTAYFIWKDPWMTIGSDTYIHDVMTKYGLINLFEDQLRYPTTTLKELSKLSPEIILLSSEPYPFKEKHIKDIKTHCPDSRIELINGEWFSWYGSRMAPSFEALNAWRSQL